MQGKQGAKSSIAVDAVSSAADAVSIQFFNHSVTMEDFDMVGVDLGYVCCR